MPSLRKPQLLLVLLAIPALACGLRASEGHAAPSGGASAASAASAKVSTPAASSDAKPSAAASPKVAKLLARARLEVTRQVDYDPAYRVLTFRDDKDTGKSLYPGGDLDPKLGVCTDVVVRGLRAAELDLQKLVHEATIAHPAWFPTVKTPDANIDHRRVPALMGYFDHAATKLSTDPASAADRATFQAGDLIVWSFDACPKCSPRHIGVVSDRKGARGLPLVIHNLGPHPTEDDKLDAWTMLRHYRVLP